jgi:dihydroorotate dehydrogenase electron transfer subunit
MAIQAGGTILENKRLKSSYFLMEMDCPLIADKTRPGQFLMLQVSGDTHPLLRRPFSIYKSYPTWHPEEEKRGHLILLYKKVGKGTEKMTSFLTGEKVNLIGPLGNGFTLPPLPSSVTSILIGGGVGMASLSSLGQALHSGKLHVFIGGKTKDDILCEEDFLSGKSTHLFIATEDGSRGKKGTVVDLLHDEIKRFDRDQPHDVYICGPEGMLKSVSKVIKSKIWNVQVSLEARMGCGFGACWGCVVRTKDVEMAYHRVCKDGPVFPLSEIAWE